MSAKLGYVDSDGVLGTWIEPSVARLALNLPWARKSPRRGSCGVAESIMGIDGLLLERIPLERWKGVGG